MGKGRPVLLGVFSADPVLSFVSAVGLGAVSGSALIVDLIGDVVTPRSLADMVHDGPRFDELSPGRPGLAVLSKGILEGPDADGAVVSLARAWPAVVVRCATPKAPWPVVPVRLLTAGLVRPRDASPAVWQPTRGASRAPGPGPVLPPLRASLARSLIAGRLPARSRWIRSWQPVWSLPWG